LVIIFGLLIYKVVVPIVSVVSQNKQLSICYDSCIKVW